jgi:two-component sensor histidine kinase
VVLGNDGVTLSVTVVDDGAGLPEGFSLDTAPGLGLSIVRTLVTTELGGAITLRPARAEDFERSRRTAPDPLRGTVVDLSVPLALEGA